MSSMPLNVLLVDQPGWARDLVATALREADLHVEAVGIEGLADALDRTRPDFVVLTEPPAATDVSASSATPSSRPRSALPSPTLPLPPEPWSGSPTLPLPPETGADSPTLPLPPESESDSPTLPLPPPSDAEQIVASHLRPRLVRLQPSGMANVYDVRLSVGQPLGSFDPVEIAGLVSSFGAR